MPVYVNHRLVHLHIPKTAGTAVEHLFEGLGDMRFNGSHWYGVEHRNGRFVELQHLTANELHRLSAGRYEHFTWFAVVRDPYQRLISEYRWRGHVVAGNPGDVRGFDTFGDLVAAIPTDIGRNWDRYIALAVQQHANLLTHLRPQWHFVSSSDRQLDPSISIVHFEQLNVELEPILQRHHVATRLPHSDRRPADLSQWYTEDALAIVNHTYAEDFDLFGYERLETVSR